MSQKPDSRHTDFEQLNSILSRSKDLPQTVLNKSAPPYHTLSASNGAVPRIVPKSGFKHPGKDTTSMIDAAPIQRSDIEQLAAYINELAKTLGVQTDQALSVVKETVLSNYDQQHIVRPSSSLSQNTVRAYPTRTSVDISVMHRDGIKETYNADMINRSIERAAQGLTNIVSKVTQIASETELTLYDGITTQELDEATINAAVQNIKDDPEFDIIATRLLLKVLYKNVLGHYTTQDELIRLHRNGFMSYIQYAVEHGLLRSEMTAVFDLETLADTLDLSRDEKINYIGLRTMMKRYMICGHNHDVIETPQYFRMRVAMGLSLNEENPTQWAQRFYEKLSRAEFVTGGSAAVGSGTPTSRLSNCYLLEIHDSIDHIAKTISDVMKLSKATGGIGLAVTKLRSSGSPVKSNNTKSSGPIPFLHTLDSTLRAVSRAGKKMGALCFYMENWHLDFNDFLDLKQNAGDEYRRTRTANTAVYISDEFMKRVKNDDDWYLFDPGETPDLCELYGEKFSKRYNEYVARAEGKGIERYKKVRAREQYRQILVSLQSNSHPWLTWKDAINVRALNNNTGTIHCSNLCTEICLPQDSDNISVCNLTYINLSRHYDSKKGDIDWDRLSESVRSAVRLLDNIVEINNPPVPEAENADKSNRAVGLGLMGFSETIEYFAYPYDSNEAYDFADKVFEFVSFHAIDMSADLARERGNYPHFPGSRWSQGWVPVDTINTLEQERGMPLTLNDKGSNWPELNWNELREKVKGGIRNATVMAIAPNANAGLVAGTSPGLDPRFAQMFSRSTNSAKYLEVNKNLVVALKQRGLWEQVKDDIVAHHGDIAPIDAIPDDIKRIYKTSFSTSAYAYIEVAARAQKWVDQAISRNMYIETRDIDEMMNIYITAWEKGLKTTYYCFMKPRHSAEQSTTKVNKSSAIGKSGFGTLKKNGTFSIKNRTSEFTAAKPQINNNVQQTEKRAQSVRNQAENPTTIANTCPVDPQERVACESCQ